MNPKSPPSADVPGAASGSDVGGNGHPRAFSEDLRQLSAQFQGQPTTLAAVVAVTQGRGYQLLLVLICLPFLTPIPMVGLSTPFGFVVCLIGGRLALDRQPWLPRRLLEREIPGGFIVKLLGAATRIVRWLEWVLRPRLVFLHAQAVFRRLSGALIMISGLLLLLPLPVPMTNMFPALTVVLLAASSLERDGVVFLVGCVLFVLTLGYFTLIACGGAQLVDELWRAVF
ncbi:MAG: exopolysaccharide biosynthesis protein [Opitutae bacterium]|nr:exopolysaccharide biosynthesis protein [Opitutae bacterium]